ncbi:LuxR C-terminal-related transcriptional regulator [Serratia rubidaea]|uniref:LuxR C-terminal-related transcriptional regulator n=1 Tax=Serratia rubidaea TaxID=61652 RepID=UPI0022B8BCC5|nr:LuxR C-terminal-related transcriptional regulator [Serratia rubidaea]WBF44095.1 LuxR C-terminal-related transcriptional regulator [Serratia rubidaea]
MNKSFDHYLGHFILYDPIPWVRIGLEAFLRPWIAQSHAVASLNELKVALAQNPRQTVIMELYGVQERLYDGLRFILHAQECWPGAAWVVLTDVENQSVLHLLSLIPNISLVSKRDNLGFILTGISSANHGLRCHSPEIRRMLAESSVKPMKALSHSEWKILALMVAGFSTQSIANNIQRSYKTVSSHKQSIKNKLGLNQVSFIRFILSCRMCYAV